MESAECSEFKKILDSNKIVVLGTSFCSACVKAKKMLKDKNFGYSDIDIGEETQLQECLFKTTNSHYVPQIFVNQKYIGGFLELKYLTDTKLLEDLVQHKL